jgi:prophage antirepressor-like protein
VNNLSQIFTYHGREVRTIIKDGEPWFVLKDVCSVLDLGQVAGVKRRLPEDVISNHPLDTPGGTQQMTIINEDGLYDVILESRKPEAKEFRKWVTSEVLPSIRKTGSYSLGDPQRLIALALVEAQKLLEAKDQQIALLKPKAEFFDQVADSKDAIDIGTASKVLKIPGFGRNNLFEFLRNEGILMQNNQPYQRFVDAGYFRVIEQKWTKPDGSTHINIKTLVYQKGLEFIRRKLKERGIKGA